MTIHFKQTATWMLTLIAAAIVLPAFKGYMAYTPRESFARTHPASCAVVRPMPPRPRSGRAAPKKETIRPMLAYVEARDTREITAYNAGDITQCSGDPCISANGENICLALDKGLRRCAANFVPLGTRIRIDTIGDCLVTDRMHYRFKHRVDLAMPLAQKKQARAFGLKKLEVKILSHM